MDETENIPDSKAVTPQLSDRSGVTDAVRVQILAAEHYSLLATRSITWTEIFSRASMFITVLSASVVALALVAQATSFGRGFRDFALLVLVFVLLVGLATFIRLGEANTEDIRMVMGMNRLRHAYLELAPELEPYFITAQTDDFAGILQSYGPGLRSSLVRFLGGTPSLVGAINAVVAGVIAVILSLSLNGSVAVHVVVGVAAALAAALVEALMVYRSMKRGRAAHKARFPS